MPKEYKAKNAWMEMEEEELNELFRFNREYADFISSNKTEREIVKGSVELLEEAGFQNMDQVSNLKKGDRVYKINRNRALIAAVIGEKTLEEGLRIVGAHLDSPRIDLKPNPLTEESELAYFDTIIMVGLKNINGSVFHWLFTELLLKMMEA